MRKISWKTILMMITFITSSLTLFIIAFSSMCLTWTGTVTLLTLVTLAGYSYLYLEDRYERIFK